MKRLMLAALLSAVTATVSAADYAIDPAHTFVRVEYLHMGYATAQIRFDKTTGPIAVDAAKKTGSADISIDVASVDTGVEKFNNHLRSPELFDAAKYPTINFKSKDFKFDGETLKAINGDLTVHGVTKPVTLDVTHFACKEHPFLKKQACGADATTTIKRSDFGVAYAVPMVPDEMKVIIQIEAAVK